MKKIGEYCRVNCLALGLAVIVAIVSYWVFYGQESFLSFPLAAGLLIAMAQKYDKAYQYLPGLILGALVFGFAMMLFSYTGTYVISNLFYPPGVPFWPFYRPAEFLTFSLIFSFICLMGGLTAIVIKGFYLLYRNNK